MGKHPRTPHGLLDATTDEQQIRAWWEQWPDAGIAERMGDGRFILDVDPRHGGDETLAALEARYGPLPKTVETSTGGGGRHLEFHCQGEVRSRVGVAPGLDVRGDGGYAVRPPTRHESGAQYAWKHHPDDVEVADAPSWLLDLVRSDSRRNGTATPGEVIPDGQRSNTLASFAGSMRRRGMTEGEIEAALLKVNADRCVPPLPDGEVSAIARSISRYPPSAASHASRLERSGFYAYLPTNSYLFVPTGELWTAKGVDAAVEPIFLGIVDGKEKWERPGVWLARERPLHHMTWAPGEPPVIEGRLLTQGGWVDEPNARSFNLYRPPQELTGDPTKAGRWVDHLRRVYPEEADHIIAWFAHRVQRPHEKINHALVLGGDQGIGKDTILAPVVYAVDPWNVAEVSPTQITGRFNGFLKSVIVRVSEVRDLGDVNRYAFYEHMKAYTASPPETLRCDEKYRPEYDLLNVCGIVYTTNHKTGGIYLPEDDRRHFVAWSPLRRPEEPKAQARLNAYFRDLYGWFEAEGNGHVAAYLRAYDLADFNPKAPPRRTGAFWEVVDASRAPEDAGLADALDALGRPDAVTISCIVKKISWSPDKPGTLLTAEHRDHKLAEWLQDRRNARQIPYRMEGVGYVNVRNPSVKDRYWAVGGRRQAVYAKQELSPRQRVAAAAKLASAPPP